MNKYLCLNKLVPFWKNNTHKLKNILISSFSNHNYLLWDVCTYWALHNFSNLEIPLDIAILISCSTYFCMILAFYHSDHQKPNFTKISQHQDESSTIKCWTVNYLDLEVYMVSNRYVSLKSLKYSCKFTEVLWGISGYSLGTAGLQSIFLQCFYSPYSQCPPGTVDGINL